MYRKPLKTFVSHVAILALAWLGACRDDHPVTGPASSELLLVVSDTASSALLALSTRVGGLAAVMRTDVASAPGELAYVSLPPGAVPTGVTATIRNQRTGSMVTVPVIGGGFDPVAVAATAGDVVEIEIRGAGGGGLLRVIRTVPGKRPPKVVRTQPPRGKRDVALNSTMVIVFSEPIDAATVTDGSIRLLRGTTPVAGRLAVSDGDRLTAVFTPATPLAAGADYELAISQDVRDLDGEPLEAAVTVPFTAVGISGPSLIAFSRLTTGDGGSNGDIYVMSSNGTGVRRLTNSMTWGSGSPAWSPDGKRLAFWSQVHRASGDRTDYSIYVVNADGSGLTRLTDDWSSYGDQSPAWSPDGERIAFSRGDCVDFDVNDAQRPCMSGGNPEIYVISVDGSGATRLTDGIAPAWSPDGSRIAFSKIDGEQTDIYVMNDDGSGVTRLTNTQASEAGVKWSPDGSRIVFHRYPDPYTPADIYAANSDGSDLRRLTYGGGESPSWSPDGSKIVFNRLPLPGSQDPGIFVMNADGTGVTDLRVPGHSPSWSPPGWVVPRRPSPTTVLERTATNDGDAQVGTVLVMLDQPFRVQLLRDGAPTSGVPVSWKIRGALDGSVLSATSTATDDAGIATVTLTLGTKSRGYVVEASVPGAAGSPVVFGARAQPGQLSGLEIVAGNEQVGVRGGPLRWLSYVVRPFDSYGNTVEALVIDWAVTSGGGQIAPLRGGGTTHWTNARHTLGPDLGPQTVTATAPGVPAVTFTSAAADAVIDVGTTDVGDCHDGFEPSAITVSRGSTVGWGWIPCTSDNPFDGAPHDVIFEDDPTQPVSSPVKRLGYHLRTFTAPGVYRYRCTLHNGEGGTVTVL